MGKQNMPEQHADKKEKKQKISKKGLFRSRSFRSGGYTVVLSLIVAAIVVAVNLFAGQIPATYTRIDTTSQQLYTLGEQTESIVGGLEKDVTIYLVAQSGYEDITIEEVLARYEALSDHIAIDSIDPVVYPKAVQQYTTASLDQNSLIVVCGDRSQVVAYDDIYVYDYSNYYTTGSYEVNFDMESALTSAIDSVTSENLPVLYTLAGHGESELSDTLTEAVEKENFLIESLSLLAKDGVPEDAGAVLILAPQSDISTEEAEKLLAYMNVGGKLLLITDYIEDEQPNLLSLCEAYGVTSANGVVCEADMNYCLRGYVHYLLPEVNSHEITDPIVDSRMYALMPLAHGIKTLDTYRDTLDITSLLSTTESAYAKVNAYSVTSLEKADGDIDGPFDVGVAVTETVDAGETRFVWFSTSQFLLDDVNSLVSGANHDLFLNSLNYLCERENSISIRSKSLMSTYLTIPSGTASALSVLITAGLPLLVIIVGVVVCVRRRKR